MDSGFVDLDILLTRIRNPQSRMYFLDAVKAYKAGALRASLSSPWVALVYDLIAKYRELDGLGDAAAAAFIQSWDAATQIADTRRLLQLEASIVDDATVNTQILNPIAQTHLDRLKQDRNYCAHPAFSAEGELFMPSHELVRMHLVNVVELVLAREPQQGTTIFNLFDNDVQSSGFPTSHARILDYVEQRYLERLRGQNVRNFGTVLAKSLIKGIPPHLDGHRAKIVSTLVALRERAPNSWPEVTTAIVRLIDGLEPQYRVRAITFIAAFPAFWDRLQEPTRTALQETVDNTDAATLTDFAILGGLSVPQFRPSLLQLIAGLSDAQLEQAVAAAPVIDLWPRAVDRYRRSGGFRNSEAYFRDLIAPFSGRLDSQHLDQLLDAVGENGQNWDAAGTPGALLALLREAGTVRPSAEARNRLYQEFRRMRRLDRYADVIALFGEDGWAVPPPAPDNDE
jgi:hypothetical protein